MSEYHDAMITLLETIWGKGFMAPGGAGNVAIQVDGLDLIGKRVLDIGCGLGGPDHLLADHFVENWHAMMVVCEKGEMRQVYVRAQKQ